jgi:hypothetical protein
MTPLETFLNWLENQNKEIIDIIASQILSFAPDYDLKKNGESDDMYDKLKTYLTSDTKVLKIVGKAIFVKCLVDFITIDYDNLNSLIESQNLFSSIMKIGLKEGLNVDLSKRYLETGPARFEVRKEFKYNWTDFCATQFNYKIINLYFENNFIKS